MFNSKKSIIIISALLILALSVTALGIFALGDSEATVKDGDWFYLSDFAPAEKVSTGYAGSDFLAINTGISTSGLYLVSPDSGKSTLYSNGMSIHAPGKIVYDISHMNATRFTSLFGVDAKQSEVGAVGLKIYTDKNASGEYIYSLDSIKASDKAEYIDIKIPAGATRLYFELTDGGNGIDYDHAVFAEPRLFADYVYLSNMDYTELKTGWGNAVLDGSIDGPIMLNTLYKGDRADGTATAKAITYTEGICIHAPSSVTYNIEGMGVTRFTAFCGISANSGNYNPTTTFKVLFDGKEVHSITKTRNNTNVSVGENIDILIPEGTKTITLTATAVGNNNGNHTCWAYPRLFGENLNSIKTLSLELESDALFIGKAEKTSVIAENYKGEKSLCSSSDIKLYAESDNITIDGNRITAKDTGKAVVRAEYIVDGTVLKSQTFEVDIFDSNSSWTVKSPDEKYEITVLIANGKIYYTASANGSVIAKLSRLGLKTSLTDYSDSLKFVSATDSREIKESYNMISGKFSTYENHCNERIITFKKDSKPEINIIIRAYDDGVAFRYAIEHSSSFKISDEHTELSIPSGSYSWYQPNTTGKHPNTHEQHFGYGEIEKYPFDITLPYMYRTPDGTLVVVSEADLDGSYCGTVLQSISESTLKFGFPEQQLSYDKSAQVSTDQIFESPWRAFVAGNEETIFLSTLFEDLSDPSVIEDTSWISPGVTAWSWMSGMRSGSDPYDYQASKTVIKMYIDLAASMGWEYYILDEGWMQRITNSAAQSQGLTGGRDWLPNGGWYTGFYSYTQEIVDYANSKNVGLIAWLHVSQIDDPKNDYEQMDILFSKLHEFGIKGIKADFFNSENQTTIKLYNKIYEKCAKYKLLANLHGSNKPTGERRTYPNVINREAIYGEELSSTKASQMVIQSYVRGLVGPTDFTPYIYPSGGSDTTMAQQLAYSVIYESGMTCFASTIDEYKKLSPELKQYFYAYPTAWNDSLYLSGSAGVDMTVARESRDGRWYIGGITTAAKTEKVTLDFLEEGESYIAYIYTDNGKRNVVYEEKTVTKGDIINASLSENGGFAIKIVKADPTLKIVNSNAHGTVSVSGMKEGNILPSSGSTITFTVEAISGYGVSHVLWNGRALELSKNGTVSVMACGGDSTFEVIYEKLSNVKVNMSSGGSVGIVQNGIYRDLISTLSSNDNEVEIIAAPGRGYVIDEITVNGEKLEMTDGRYVFDIAESTTTVWVFFKKIK